MESPYQRVAASFREKRHRLLLTQFGGAEVDAHLEVRRLFSRPNGEGHSLPDKATERVANGLEVRQPVENLDGESDVQ
jgi:hypothetical protein